jgi:hypothetical protein
MKWEEFNSQDKQEKRWEVNILIEGASHQKENQNVDSPRQLKAFFLSYAIKSTAR